MDAALLYGTFGLLMFGPLAFGAVEPWSTFILEAGSALLALLWLTKQWIEGEVTIRWNPLFLRMAAFGFLILLQIVVGTTAYCHHCATSFFIYLNYL